ncbi:Sugar ABC transporter permease [Planctomycetales bacterium 10988]|nr:Sugar ABC transporter permease [Planctomycetales bacterium 10988]
MKKVLGIFILLVVVMAFTASMQPQFMSAYNLQNVLKWTSLYGILGIGVAFVIITGGIDLSIGSVVGLSGAILPLMLTSYGWSIPAAIGLSLVISLAIGLLHGVLVTQLGLQSFVVTLCGLLVYRGVARWITGDATQGFGSEYDDLRWLATGKVALPGIEGFQFPVPFFILLAIALLAAFFLNLTIYGRYLLALGRNEQAARYSGIPTHWMILLAYVISALTAGLGGILFALEINSVQPSSQGNFYELYAIAAAVLGGCSLRGGEGSILGVILGTAILIVLKNAIIFLSIPSSLEFAIIGLVIILGVITDEIVKRWATYRRTVKQAKLLKS